MKTLRVCIFGLLLLGLSLPHHANSQVPRTMTYQGVVTDAAGNPVSDNSYSLTFRLYDAASGGSTLWTETQSVLSKKGLFNVLLGSTTPLLIPFDKPYWLGITIGSGSEMTPRTALSGTPYSHHAIRSDSTLGLADSIVTARMVKRGQMVRSVNGIRDSVFLIGGSSIDIVKSNDTLRFSATTSGSGTPDNVPNTIVQRDGTGSFAAGSVTLNGDLKLPLAGVAAGKILSGGVTVYHNTGTDNLFAGAGAGNLAITGMANTGLGHNTLLLNTSGLENTACGAYSLTHNTTGNQNTAQGSFALYNNSNGYCNSSLGYISLYSNTSGSYNVACGIRALYFNTTGMCNTALGAQAMMLNNTGSFNTASGDSALLSNVSGHNNTASGFLSLASNTSGSYNTANGSAALRANDQGPYNTAIGASALQYSTAGGRNTAVGYGTLLGIRTGSYNTAIGYGADVGGADLSNATAIGANAVATASNTIQLGDAQIEHIYAKVNIETTSDSTKKENRIPIDGEKVLGSIRLIEIDSWNFKGQDPVRTRHYGPMAQDFFAAFGHDELGTIGTDTSINSGDLAGISLAAIRALEKRTAEIVQLKEKIAQQTETIETLKQSLSESIARFAHLEVMVKTLQDSHSATRLAGEAQGNDHIVNR